MWRRGWNAKRGRRKGGNEVDVTKLLGGDLKGAKLSIWHFYGPSLIYGRLRSTFIDLVVLLATRRTAWSWKYIAHVMNKLRAFWPITLSQIRNFLVFTQHYFHHRKKMLQGFSPFDHSICYRIHTLRTYEPVVGSAGWIEDRTPPSLLTKSSKGEFCQ